MMQRSNLMTEFNERITRTSDSKEETEDPKEYTLLPVKLIEKSRQQ